MNYQQLLQKLYQVNLFGGVKLGLMNSLSLDKALGQPSKKMRFVHVAGTNGKGSVSTKIAKALSLSGYKTGLFTSPHISSFRERIRINEEMISEKAIIDLLSNLFKITSQENLQPTFFEYVTLLALAYFKEEGVEYAVMETGMGGRLDATNIILPEVSVITSISLEHTEILGSTLTDITREKAGIIKSNTPVVIGPRVPFEEIQKIATEKKAPVFQVKGLFDTFYEENEAIAENTLRQLKIEPAIIEQGLKINPHCRMETVLRGEKTVVLDVAHNPDGLLNLFKAIEMKKPAILFGLSKGKDIDACLDILKENASSFYPVEALNGRGICQNKIKHLLLSKGVSETQIFCCTTIEESLRKALLDHNNLLVCGTFFIMSEVRRNLDMKEPRDFIDMNECSMKRATQ